MLARRKNASDARLARRAGLLSAAISAVVFVRRTFPPARLLALALRRLVVTVSDVAETGAQVATLERRIADLQNMGRRIIPC
jgi:hypothetical protein